MLEQKSNIIKDRSEIGRKISIGLQKKLQEPGFIENRSRGIRKYNETRSKARIAIRGAERMKKIYARLAPIEAELRAELDREARELILKTKTD